MKKLISIGVALALLTMAVVPGAVAAYTTPDTYAKVPFAILASGFELLETLWPDLDAALGMDMLWLETIFGELASWTAGPLSWTVDMLAWGLGLGADIMDALDPVIGPLPLPVGDLLNDIACGLMTCWSATNCTGTFDPCTP